MAEIEVQSVSHVMEVPSAEDLIIIYKNPYPYDLSISMNTRTMAMSQYCGLRFNSFCVLDDGSVFGASENGLFQFDGSDEDDYAQIVAQARSKTTDFGAVNPKRIRSMYFNGEADGSIKVTVRNDETNSRERIFTPKNTSGRQQTAKLSVGRDGKGANWDFTIENIDGSAFGVDNLTVVPIILTRKPSGS